MRTPSWNKNDLLVDPADPDDGEIRMSADSASTRGDTYTLTGDAVVSRGREQISGDLLIYNRTESSAEAIGNVRYISPDLIVSGVNGGLNAGINVLYSGTVAAAILARARRFVIAAFLSVCKEGLLAGERIDLAGLMELHRRRHPRGKGD